MKFECLELLGISYTGLHYKNSLDGIEEVVRVLVVVLVITPEQRYVFHCFVLVVLVGWDGRCG